MENVTILMVTPPDLAGKVRYLVSVGENDPHEHFLKFDDGTPEEVIFEEARRVHNLQIEKVQKQIEYEELLEQFETIKNQLNNLSSELGYVATF